MCLSVLIMIPERQGDGGRWVGRGVGSEVFKEPLGGDEDRYWDWGARTGPPTLRSRCSGCADYCGARDVERDHVHGV